jgi:hypothetical protein
MFAFLGISPEQVDRLAQEHMRSAMPLTSASHCSFSFGSVRSVAATRAPCTGGFE